MRLGRRAHREQPAEQSAVLVFGVDPNDGESLDYGGVQYARALIELDRRAGS